MIEKLRLLVSWIVALSLVATLFLSQNGWQTRAPFMGAFLFVLGIVLASIGSFGRIWCSLYIAGYKTDSLIMDGPYSMCRNPLYFFSFLGAVGVGFTTGTFLVPAVIVLAFGVYYPLVIKSEETGLKTIHHDAFEHYLKKVPSFFPKLALLKEPEEYIVKPVLFRIHLCDAIWFIWCIGIIVILKELHEHHILPSLLTIY